MENMQNPNHLFKKQSGGRFPPLLFAVSQIVIQHNNN